MESIKTTGDEQNRFAVMLHAQQTVEMTAIYRFQEKNNAKVAVSKRFDSSMKKNGLLLDNEILVGESMG